ncbi:hypothetical protein GGX14DRAFT_388769 [Mycena pura]|uniref:Uncharacterized protein n=1 Tax=Mycena pura TaxID=153505 RepID=A0AAD6VV59_9AGAR|nr:hypothetical protein GGX14DRAFT_388769 [Mycena pura]
MCTVLVLFYVNGSLLGGRRSTFQPGYGAEPGSTPVWDSKTESALSGTVELGTAVFRNRTRTRYRISDGSPSRGPSAQDLKARGSSPSSKMCGYQDWYYTCMHGPYREVVNCSLTVKRNAQTISRFVSQLRIKLDGTYGQVDSTPSPLSGNSKVLEV